MENLDLLGGVATFTKFSWGRTSVIERQEIKIEDITETALDAVTLSLNLVHLAALSVGEMTEDQIYDLIRKVAGEDIAPLPENKLSS